jgi:CheY-like chemotaxis protein
VVRHPLHYFFPEFPLPCAQQPRTVKRILIADDQPVGRELLRTVLESSGYEIVEAEDGDQALAQALSSTPDLILLDIHMPGRDGISVVTELRQDRRFASTPVIAVTATAMKGDRQKGLDAGFSEYLTKPVSIAMLRQIIARYLWAGSAAAPGS